MKGIALKGTGCIGLMVFALVLIAPLMVSVGAEAVQLPSIVSTGENAETIIEDGLSEFYKYYLMFILGLAGIASLRIGNYYFQGEHEQAAQQFKWAIYGLGVIAIMPYVVSIFAKFIG